MYKVVEFFTDLQDNNHAYHVGDTFPREGVEVSEDRLKELSTDKNKRGKILIEEVEEDISEESPETAKEEPQEEEADVDSPKKPKAKKTPKKA